MRLTATKPCPLHNRRDCCGRKKATQDGFTGGGAGRRQYVSFEPGVVRIPDDHHSRGYRERRSPSAMARLLENKVREQELRCAICGQEFTDARQIVPDHVEPRTMGGAWRDDHPGNIQAVHNFCNLKKGSKRNFTIGDAGNEVTNPQ